MAKILTYRKHKKYKNPFCSQQKKPISKRIKLNILLLFTCAILWLYFLFFSPFFMFKDISIQIEDDFREKKLIEEQINNYFKSSYFFSLHKKNYFFFNENKLKQELNKHFFVKNVRAEKSFPNHLLINVERIKPSFILNSPYEILYLDSSGVILEKVPKNNNVDINLAKNLPVILVHQDNELNIKDKIFSEDFLNFINKFFVLLKENKPNINIETFEAKNIEQTQGTIKIKLANMGYLYLNTSLDPEQQLENFLTIYKEKIQPQNKQFEYIDLRFGDKIYIKYNE